MSSGDVSDAGQPVRGGASVATNPEAAPTGRSIPGGRHVFVIGSMAVVAIACVYGLSRGARGPTGADAKQSLIEQQVECAVKGFDAAGKADPKSVVRADDVAKSFYYQATERQVPLARLRGNPFVYKPAEPKVGSAPASMPSPGDATPGKKPEPAAVPKLLLQSVLVGSQGRAAMISDNLLTRGQQIDGWTVVEINSRSVVLEREGAARRVLTMPE